MKITKIAGKMVKVIWEMDPETGQISAKPHSNRGNKTCMSVKRLLPDGSVTGEQDNPNGVYPDDGQGGGPGSGPAVPENEFAPKTQAPRTNVPPQREKA